MVAAQLDVVRAPQQLLVHPARRAASDRAGAPCSAPRGGHRPPPTLLPRHRPPRLAATLRASRGDRVTALRRLRVALAVGGRRRCSPPRAEPLRPLGGAVGFGSVRAGEARGLAETRSLQFLPLGPAQVPPPSKPSCRPR